MRSVTVLFVLFFTSCKFYPQDVQTVLRASDPELGLASVIEKYREHAADSLKLTAAYQLISSLPYHSFHPADPRYDPAFDSISRMPDGPGRRSVFENLVDSINKIHGFNDRLQVTDLKVVDKNFLINNIELAFREWLSFPKNKRAGFSDFFNYVLPYRVYNEPIESDSRNKLLREYRWAKQLLLRGVPLHIVADSILRGKNFTTSGRFPKLYRGPLSISLAEKSRIGVCNDGVIYFVQVFRALGLVSSFENLPQWGNHHLTGHSWIYVKYGKEDYAVNIMPGKKDIRQSMPGESIAKVYRIHTISESYTRPRDRDVTHLYNRTVTLKLKPQGPETRNLSLNIFNANSEWAPVADPQYANDSLYWKKVGINVLYLLGTWRQDQFIPYGYPFFINGQKRRVLFKPDQKATINAKLVRKYGLSSPRNPSKLDWIRDLNGVSFLCSGSPDSSSFKKFYQVSGLSSYQEQQVQLPATSAYRYLRIKSGQRNAYFSKLVFFDGKHRAIPLTCLDQWPEGYYHGTPQDLADEKSSTYFGGKNLDLRFLVSRNKVIRSFEYQARTDDNEIKQGDTYELFYWDRKWKSLGRKVAADTLLTYSGVSRNTLFLLKNLSHGSEIHPFTIRNDGAQQWLGFDNPATTSLPKTLYPTSN